MIFKNGKNIKDINHKGYSLSKVYNKEYLVWLKNKSPQEYSSCYGSGHWINSLPWLNDDAWKNN